MLYKAVPNEDGTWEVATGYGLTLTKGHFTQEQATDVIAACVTARTHGEAATKEELRRWLGVTRP